MATKWLVLELFSGRRPSVISVGRSQKRFVALERIINNRLTLAEAKAAVAQAAATCRPVDRVSDDGARRTVAVPLPISPTRLHGIMLWSGPPSEPLPARDRVGAWYFNVTAGISTRSDELLDLYGVPREQWAGAREHSIAAVYAEPLTPNYNNQGDVLAKIIRAENGRETQDVWTLRRPDGELRAAAYSCRQLDEVAADGTVQKILRGITLDIGPATETPAAPPPTLLEHRVLEAAAEDGEFRAIVDPRSLHLLRWMGPPMPGIAWESLAGQPAPGIHPQDLAAAREMSEGLREGRTAAQLRLRGLDGGWISVQAKAALMLLDQTTTAALVTLRVTDPNTP